MEGIKIPLWQLLSLSSLFAYVVAASLLGLTRRIRSVAQPWVTRRVLSDTSRILWIQKWHHGYLDNFFSLLSCVVSVPFYTGFIPLLFWSGHSKLGRQTTLLIAFCDYIGNSIKDAVSAPRPGCPPVRRVTATEDEKENAMEYGLPSSHALNTVCLSGFIDVVVGITIGLVILASWTVFCEHIDDFVINGQNVTYFWAGLSLLLCFAYPTPEVPTPSFEYHTAFNGVAFGIVSGIQQTYALFHSDDVPRIFSPELSLPLFLGRILVGIPTILVVKFCSKALAKWLLPIICNTLGVPIRSSGYVPVLKESDSSDNKPENKQNGFLHRVVSLLPHKNYDVDTGIRFLQYAGLAWSAVDLVPHLFSLLSL
ncbi:hypothetical protein HPP92_007775 [Vanilla planifolia]|uniref:Uncharacterized protein n=1 Tax=Vanilla planifolia TaxID=51239 RepID=A0A835V9X7_VANPL|nr:hypothetical protein HPP92_007775 [Vanilla planifolia]